MGTTQPIRDKDLLKKFKDFYVTTEPNIRNYTIIIMGLNTALRISDILKLTCNDVYDDGGVRDYITIKEQKTGKENRIFLNEELHQTLFEYYQPLTNTDMYKNGNPYLFPSPRNTNHSLSRYQTYRMICAAAEGAGLEGNISCHSLRKTFGYHAWKQGKDPVVIMAIFNHSSFDITKRYLCIEQDDKDAVFRDIKL